MIIVRGSTDYVQSIAGENLNEGNSVANPKTGGGQQNWGGMFYFRRITLVCLG